METLVTSVRVDGSLCGQCGGCVPVCSFGALYLSPSELMIDRDLCTLCGDCIEFCPVEALELSDE